MHSFMDHAAAGVIKTTYLLVDNDLFTIWTDVESDDLGAECADGC
jgi:hypothetical protein